MTLISLFVVAATLASAVAGYSDNCNGSGECSLLSTDSCRAAYGKYDDSTNYNHYTSRVSGNCAAIVRCNGVYPNANGATLKAVFSQINDSQNCRHCGSRAFYDGSCEVTLNYCALPCSQSG